MGTVPVGTIIAMGNVGADFAALEQQGWWVCDGRTVTDPTAVILQNAATPNLMAAPDQWRLGRSLVGAGSVGAGQAVGAALSPIPDMKVKVETDGWDASKTVHADPRLLVYSALTWVDGSPITSSGTATAGTARIAVEPPSYTVTWLILVK